MRAGFAGGVDPADVVEGRVPMGATEVVGLLLPGEPAGEELLVRLTEGCCGRGRPELDCGLALELARERSLAAMLAACDPSGAPGWASALMGGVRPYS